MLLWYADFPPVSVKDRSADFFRIAIQAPSRFGCRVPSSILLSIATVVMTLRSSGEGLNNTQKINAECCKLLRFSGKCVIILPTVRDGGFRFRSSARPNRADGSGIRPVLSGWPERAVCGNARPERPVGNTKTTPRGNPLSATERERFSP